MHVVIWTQYRENYGEPGSSYWKNKGGSTYVVSDISVSEAQSLSSIDQPFFSKLLSLIEYSNSASSETMVDWELRDGEFQADPDSWDTPIFIRREGDQFVAEETIVNNDWQFRDEIASKRSTWIMTLEGGRRNYQPEYTLRDGRVLNEEEFIKEVVYQKAS